MAFPLALIPLILGIGSQVLGKKKGKGKETEYTAQAPEYQQQFSEDFMKFLQGKIGQGATPYGGQIAAGAMNPFTQSALNLWGRSPYGMGQGMPFGGQPQMPQMPPQGFLGGGMVPGGQRSMPPLAQRPMQGPRGVPFSRSGLGLQQGMMGQGMQPQGQMPMQRPMLGQGGLGQRRRGVPFQR